MQDEPVQCLELQLGNLKSNKYSILDFCSCAVNLLKLDLENTCHVLSLLKLLKQMLYLYRLNYKGKSKQTIFDNLFSSPDILSSSNKNVSQGSLGNVSAC